MSDALNPAENCGQTGSHPGFIFILSEPVGWIPKKLIATPPAQT
jgi:hypothetical protein